MTRSASGPATTALFAALALGGCGGGPEQRAQQAREAVASSVASARRVVDDWSAGRVRTSFARVAVEGVMRSLARQRAGIEAKPKLLADARVAEAMALVEQAERTLARLFVAIDSQDAPRAREAAEQLEQKQPGR